MQFANRFIVFSPVDGSGRYSPARSFTEPQFESRRAKSNPKAKDRSRRSNSRRRAWRCGPAATAAATEAATIGVGHENRHAHSQNHEKTAGVARAARSHRHSHASRARTAATAAMAHEDSGASAATRPPTSSSDRGATKLLAGRAINSPAAPPTSQNAGATNSAQRPCAGPRSPARTASPTTGMLIFRGQRKMSDAVVDRSKPGRDHMRVGARPSSTPT